MYTRMSVKLTSIQDVLRCLLSIHEKWIKHCYDLAQVSHLRGDHPFGALLVSDGSIQLESTNCVVTKADITGHAEMNLIREASKIYPRATLATMTLYSSTEPCAMCVGAIYWSGIRKIVYGVSGKDLADWVNEEFAWSARELLSRSGETFDIHGPVLPELGMKMHRLFWT